MEPREDPQLIVRLTVEQKIAQRTGLSVTDLVARTPRGGTLTLGGYAIPSEGGFKTGMLIGCAAAVLAAVTALAIPLRKANPEGEGEGAGAPLVSSA